MSLVILLTSCKDTKIHIDKTKVTKALGWICSIQYLGLNVSALEDCFAILDGNLYNESVPIKSMHLMPSKLQNPCV